MGRYSPKQIINVLVFVVVILGIGYWFNDALGRLAYTWRWSSVPQYLFRADIIEGASNWVAGPLLVGLWITLKISFLSIIFAILIGLFAGLARISDHLAFKWLAIGYVELIRGTPLLVQIFIFYFFVGTVLDMDRLPAAVAALSVFTGAYVAEIVRAGIQSIAKGQMEAARSLGMTYTQAMRHVVLPQAFRRILPPLAGQFISLIKDSSLVSVIALNDLTKTGREVIASTFATFEIWFTVAGLYLVLTFTLSMLTNYLERRYHVAER
jgi:polar amino acid transport system permease protein